MRRLLAWLNSKMERRRYLIQIASIVGYHYKTVAWACAFIPTGHLPGIAQDLAMGLNTIRIQALYAFLAFKEPRNPGRRKVSVVH